MTTADTTTQHAEPDEGMLDGDCVVDTYNDVAVREADEEAPPDVTKRIRSQRLSWSAVLVYGLLPVIAILLAAGTGYLKYRDGTIKGADTARAESVQAATEATIAILTYNPQNVEATLHGAEDRLTGEFRKSYRSLVDDVVIPGAKQKSIAATATVPAAASMTATANHATVMVFVNQSTIVGADAPTDTASAVEVTLDRIGQRWLVSGFVPK